MAIGTTAAIALGLGAIGTGVALSKTIGKSQPIASPQPLPKPPSADAVKQQATDAVRRKRVSASKSVFTSPLGIAGEANIAKKTLLGH